jgi:hypothetical protein
MKTINITALEWFDTETGKLWRRIDKNSSENKRCPRFLKSKVDKLRLDFLNTYNKIS